MVFFNPTAVAIKVDELLEDVSLFEKLGWVERQTSLGNFDLNSLCIPQLLQV